LSFTFSRAICHSWKAASALALLITMHKEEIHSLSMLVSNKYLKQAGQKDAKIISLSKIFLNKE